MNKEEESQYIVSRENMVKFQLEKWKISDPRVLEAMRNVPRELFVPEDMKEFAYDDGPLPIGLGQTISQPYIVALMTEALELKKGDKVLEIGTGSGYQSAVLAEMVKLLYSVEITKFHADAAKERLHSLGYDNISCKLGDGYHGWPEKAPFDAIIITAAADHIPKPLADQLKDGGKLILPKGKPSSHQDLMLFTKKNGNFSIKYICGVRFVPMTGKALES